MFLLFILFLIGLGLVWYGYKNNSQKLTIIGASAVGLIVLFFTVVFISPKIFLVVIIAGGGYWLWKRAVESRAEAKEIRMWERKNFPNRKPEEFFSEVKRIALNYNQESSLKVPIGRAIYFSQSDEKFQALDNDADFLSYHGESSQDEKSFSFLEYGWLISSEAIYYRHQEETIGKWKDSTIYIPFSGAYKVSDSNVYYANKTKISLKALKGDASNFLTSVINDAISIGYTKNLYRNSFDTDSELATVLDSSSIVDTIDGRINNMAFSQSMPNYNNMASAGIRNSYVGESQLNQAINGTQGHGVSAEWGNTSIDRLRGRYATTQPGGTNLKYGGDRLVGRTLVQTKYYQTYNNGVPDPGNARASVGAYLKNVDGYFSNGVKQVEVPRDQFPDAVQRMKQAISDGKIPGENNPNNAKRYVRKGVWTYDQSLQIAKCGTIPSISVDVAGGITSSIPGASIGALMTYWNARSNGMEMRDAIKVTGGVFAKSMLMGTLTYAGTMQLTKLIFNNGSKSAVKTALTKFTTAMPEQAFKRLNILVTLTIQVAPSILKSFEGKQSWSDVGSELTTGISGISGMSIGGVIGTAVLPGVGTAVGAIVGSFAASFVGSKVGKMIFGQSSQTVMMNLLKEEFIDAVYQSPLNQDEIQSIMQSIFNDKSLKKTLGFMYKSNDRRWFARENIIYPRFQFAYNNRRQVSENEFENVSAVLAV